MTMPVGQRWSAGKVHREAAEERAAKVKLKPWRAREVTARLVQDGIGQWYVVIGDGSPLPASDVEVALWKLLEGRGKVVVEQAVDLQREVAGSPRWDDVVGLDGLDGMQRVGAALLTILEEAGLGLDVLLGAAVRSGDGGMDEPQRRRLREGLLEMQAWLCLAAQGFGELVGEEVDLLGETAGRVRGGVYG